MIDSHAHVAFAQFDGDREGVIERARRVRLRQGYGEQASVRWVEVGTDVAQSRAAVALAEHYPDDVLGATVGVHPSDIAALTEDDWRELEELLSHRRVVAVGEVGLDYYRGGWREMQLPVLERFVALAVAHDLPVVFHVRSGAPASLAGKGRDAHADLPRFLQARDAAVRGVVHTFSGTAAQAEEYLKLGLYLSISGVVTFKNAGAMAEVARTVPLDRLLVETDCPFLAPEPYRGRRNEPAYVEHVVQRVAALRGVSADTVAQATVENATRLFGVKK